jgi:hypothetical protein
MRRLAAPSLSLALLSLVTTACRDAPTQAQCEQLLDHVIDLELAQASAGSAAAPSAEELATQRQEFRAFTGKDFIAQCTNDLPARRVTCGLAARTKADQLACDDE